MLENLVQQAKQCFESGRSYPLIDSNKLDVTNFCCDLTLSFYDIDILESVRAEVEALLARDPNDLACRFVTLRIFFALSLKPA